MRVAIVAAEPSGDQLGAGLMRALRARLPGILFEGIGGPGMIEAGLRSEVPMERLSVMGLTEIVAHLPELLAIRRRLRKRLEADPPALFIGIDAPDFNLGLERDLKRAGIATLHYVSPTVWAWRGGRVKTLRAAVDRVLCIFPFEEDFLRRQGIDARFVGHPLAERYPLECDVDGARAELGIGAEGPVLALLPGSRRGEVERLAESFLGAASILQREAPALRVLVPLASEAVAAVFDRARVRHAPELRVDRRLGSVAEILTAADVVLTASGTATLEALLCKKPMVVGYRVAASTYWIARLLRLVDTPHFAMANLLAGERLAPEFIQYDCVPERLAAALRGLLADPARRAAIAARYAEIHRRMGRDADRRAADAVVELLERRA